MRELDLSLRPDYPYRFDLEKGYRPIRFMEKYCIPTKGDYSSMKLMPWQQFIEGNLYGWVHKETGLRRFREGVILVGSGNGKSTLITGNGIYGVSQDGERGAEVYCIANAKDQSRIIGDEARAQIESNRVLNYRFRCTREGIFFDQTRSKFQALASDPTVLDGKNVHMAIFDEVQDYRDYEFINRLKKKIIKRSQPLVLYISTLGSVIDGPLMDLYVTGGHILADTGVIDLIAADSIFVYIDEIDEDDDPNNEKCWIKANPSIGVLLKMDDLRRDWATCKAVPATRSDWINKQLNVFTSVNELSFLDNSTILANNKTHDVAELDGKSCYGGFDMSETEDFTSACLEFPLDNGDYVVLSHSWVPEHKVKENHEKLDWDALQAACHLTVIPGSYIKPHYVFDWFVAMAEKYRILSIGYDRARAVELIRMLTDHGFTMAEVRQGELTLIGPLDNLKERFLDGGIIHNNNKLFNWYLSNIKVSKRSANGTYLPTKRNRYRKIDGFAALLNAHTEMLRRRPTEIPPDRTVTRVIRLG